MLVQLSKDKLFKKSTLFTPYSDTDTLLNSSEITVNNLIEIHTNLNISLGNNKFIFILTSNYEKLELELW